MSTKFKTYNLPKIEQYEPFPVVEERNGYFVFKRIIDLSITLSALVILIPVMVTIAILISLDSEGPIFFIQPRVGSQRKRNKNGTHWQPVIFNCYKFRTMNCRSDDSIHKEYTKALISHDLTKTNEIQGGETKTYKILKDPRVTRIGKYLRKFSLDELPQLWNIVLGEMSLVGPRPPISYEVEEYEPWHYQRLEAKPGLTGLWQVTARSSCDFDEMVQLDIEYIKHQSIWLDIKIIFKTPLVVLSTEGAH